MNHPASPSKLFALAISEWLLVLPATLLLAAAALRQLQPAQHEPARTISMIFSWIGPRISHFDAALLFLALPGVAAVVGFVTLLRLWRRNETLRQDVTTALASFRRHLPLAILGMGTLLAGAILVAVVIHMITD